MVLKVENLHARYGPLKVLFGVDLALAEGETLALVGANGAGKSTSFSILSGLLPAAEGVIELSGTTIRDMPTGEIVKRGLVMVPEGRKLFPSLTVEGKPACWRLCRKKGPDGI